MRWVAAGIASVMAVWLFDSSSFNSALGCVAVQPVLFIFTLLLVCRFQRLADSWGWAGSAFPALPAG